MTAYSDERDKITRRPQELITLSLDFCSRTFGVAPCTATGEKCYNTFATTKDKLNYANGGKDYEFSRKDRDIIEHGIRPYVIKTSEAATEINPEVGLATNARLTIDMEDDENDSDVGMDPYVASRSSVQGSFLKKFFARNKFYLGRTVTRRKGFQAIDKGDYEINFKGVIEKVEGPSGKQARIICKDFLKKLDSIKVPVQSEGTLSAAIDNSVTTVPIDDATEYKSSGWVRSDDEIIQYSGKSANNLTGCTRGALGTTADSHDLGADVQQCYVQLDKTPWYIINDIWQNEGGLAASDVDVTGSQAESDAWHDGFSFDVIISDPEDSSKIVIELADQSGAYTWWDGDEQKAKFKVVHPALPGESVQALTDIDIVKNKRITVDRNEESRKSLIVMHYNIKSPVADKGVIGSYANHTLDVDADKEGPNEYNRRADRTIFSRFIIQDAVAAVVIGRKLSRFKEPPVKLTIPLELKDDYIKVGSLVDITTSELQDVDGTAKTIRCEVIKKTPPKKNEFSITALDTRFSARIGVFAPDGLPDYGSADDDDKLYAYFSDDDGLINGEDGYYFY